jgi:hypothetical protein
MFLKLGITGGGGGGEVEEAAAAWIVSHQRA